MTLTSVSITQPYYFYEEENYYNVVPAIITLNFDSLPSQSPADYVCIADFGSIYAQYTLYFSLYSTQNNPNIVFTGNSVRLTMGITFDSGCTIRPSYQGINIPYTFYAEQDPSYSTPAIWSFQPTP
jgi:hypothetical protein